MRVDEGRKGSTLLAIKMKARVVVGRGDESLLSEHGVTSREGERGIKKAKIINGMSEKNRKT